MTVLEPQGIQREPSAWDLSELVSDSSEEGLSASLSRLERSVEAFEGCRSVLENDLGPDELLGLVRRYEALSEQMAVLGAYASLWFSADTQSQAALTCRNRMQQTLTAFHNRILFFSVWWRNLDEERAEALLPTEEAHADYRFYLFNLRRFRPYTLDEKSEQIINLKDADGIDAIVTLYSMLTNRFEFTMEVNGETLSMSRDRLSGYVYSPDPQLRAAAYRELHRVYANEAQILTQMYVNRVRDWHNENVELRGFPSAIGVRNVVNDIPHEAVDSLLEVTDKNSHLFQRYFQMKGSWLGMEKLRRYDIYAPLTPSQREVRYEKAVTLVLETFEGFHPDFARMAQRVFEDGHIDSEVRPGKRAGGFCSSVLPGLTPWVLLNYTGKVRDVATLAHELGHAIHAMMAANHSVLTHSASLPLAETASVFAEMLVTDRLLAQEEDPLARRELLASAVEDVYATVTRQAYFVRFEIEAHRAILDYGSPEELQELYMANLHSQFGDSLEIAPEFRNEWLAIPHIYSTPFYCYSYSFGQLLVLALYHRYREEGDAFKPGYLKLLSYGGSARPEAILKEVGIDVGDPGFWQSGFDVVADMISHIEAMEA